MLTFGLGIIILQVVSRRKSLAGVNIMLFFRVPARYKTQTRSAAKSILF
jgi:hypothetical protein